jgi:hypothetical protein
VVNNADRHELLSVVATVHHEGVGETLDDWALCLSESLLGISAGSVGDVDWGADLDVVADSKLAGVISQSSPSSAPVFDCNWDSLRQGDVTDLDILVAPVRLRISNALYHLDLNPPPGERTTC